MRTGRILVIALVAITLAGATASTAGAKRLGHRAVSGWVERLLGEVEAQRTNPPQTARQLAVLSVSMQRALDRAAGRRGLARRAVVAGAARHALDTFYGDPDTAPPPAGRSHRFGRRIAKRVLAQCSGDELGVTVSVPEAFPAGSDAAYLWEPTPPAYQQHPLEPRAGDWHAWRIERARRYLPEAPPSADPSHPSYGRFLRQLREVYDVSLALDDRRREIADAWAGGPGTVTPPGMWNEIAIRAIENRRKLFETERRGGKRERQGRIGARRAALIFAALNTAQADAFIVAWLTKYEYWSPRPITYIRKLIDPEWETYVPTPPFPSYVSGHSTVSGAAARLLSEAFPARRKQLRRLGLEATDSRLYGGIHYRADNLIGFRVGRRVAEPSAAWYSKRPG